MNQLEMQSLLNRWSTLEPQRCNCEGGHIFEVLYQNQWYPVSSHHSSSHGTLIAAILEACEVRNYLYSIERIPSPEADAGFDCEPQILVGVGMRDAWRSKQGKSLTSLIPELLLVEYLNCLEKDY